MGGVAAYSDIAIWVGDWNYCGVPKPVGVCKVVGGANVVGRAGEQLGELGSAGDDSDDATERCGGERAEGLSEAAGLSRDCVCDCAAATPPRLEPWEEIAPLLREEEVSALQDQKNVPLAIQQQMGALLRQCQVRGWIDIAHWRAMDNNLDDLVDAQGGAERIKVTPMPKQYDYFPQLFVQMYCLMLPLALVMNMGWFTPLGSTLVGFIFLALD